MIVFLFGFSTICNATIFEMNFYDDINDSYQSLEFDSTIDEFNSYGKYIYFKDVKIYDEGQLYELSPISLRDPSPMFINDLGFFSFNISTSQDESPYNNSATFIESKSIYTSYFDYSGVIEAEDLTDNFLEEILNKMVDCKYFFSYNFYNQNPNNSGLQNSRDDTTLISWNYKTSSVSISSTIWLCGSGILGLIGIHRNKK